MSPRGRVKPVPAGSVAELLRKIRDDAGITSGADAGNLIGVTQATISRWEGGRQVPTPEQAEQYARALRAPASIRRQLVTATRDLHEQHRAAAPARVAVTRSAEHEKRVRRNEQRSTHIGTFHPVVVPGLLQTEGYIRAIFATSGLSEPAADARIAERMARASILDDSGRRFTFVLTEGALGWRAGGTDTMITQIDHIVRISHRPHVAIGVIPWGAQAAVFPPYGFDLYDEHTVVAGVVGGATYYNNPADVGRHVRLLKGLCRMAGWGAQAQEILTRLADRYRELGA